MKKKSQKEIKFEKPSEALLLANRYVLFIMAFIILSILILGYFFALKPKINSISSVELVNTETADRKLLNESLLTKLKELEAEYKDILNNRQEDLAILKKMVPQGTQTAELFVLADRLAKKYDFQLMNIDISEGTPSGAFNEKQPAVNDMPEEIAAQIDNTDTAVQDTELKSVEDVLAASGIKSTIIHLSISKTVEEGSDILGEEVYNSFKDYVAEIENNMRLLDVQTINFGEIAYEGEAVYTFSLDLITYYQ